MISFACCSARARIFSCIWRKAAASSLRTSSAMRLSNCKRASSWVSRAICCSTLFSVWIREASSFSRASKVCRLSSTAAKSFKSFSSLRSRSSTLRSKLASRRVIRSSITRNSSRKTFVSWVNSRCRRTDSSCAWIFASFKRRSASSSAFCKTKRASFAA